MKYDAAAVVLAFDHVILAVRDLDVAARRLREEHGLASVVGGRHPGHGTANRVCAGSAFGPGAARSACDARANLERARDRGRYTLR